jgi:hypothetical protein
LAQLQTALGQSVKSQQGQGLSSKPSQFNSSLEKYDQHSDMKAQLKAEKLNRPNYMLPKTEFLIEKKFGLASVKPNNEFCSENIMCEN